MLGAGRLLTLFSPFITTQKNISLPFQPERSPELMNLDTDVSPSVQIKDNQAIVSCCFWND